MRTLILALPACLFAAVAMADGTGIVEGRGVALDGDVVFIYPIEGVEFGGGRTPETVRLWGIEAPELAAGNGHDWVARAILNEFLASDGGHVRCTVIQRDRDNNPVAKCRTVKSGVDLGKWVIGRGWAVENRAETNGHAAAYAAAEALAREAKIGRWAPIYGE